MPSFCVTDPGFAGFLCLFLTISRTVERSLWPQVSINTLPFILDCPSSIEIPYFRLEFANIMFAIIYQRFFTYCYESYQELPEFSALHGCSSVHQGVSLTYFRNDDWQLRVVGALADKCPFCKCLTIHVIWNSRRSAAVTEQ